MLHCLYLFRDQDMITITHCSCHCFFYRLFSLIEGLKDRELCVFFRNNHFSTMFKLNRKLYLLASDQGYLNQPDLVWEELISVDGDTVFTTGSFSVFQADNCSNTWNEQDAVAATADYMSLHDKAADHGGRSIYNSDLQLAMALQQQELEQQQQPRLAASSPSPPASQTSSSLGPGRMITVCYYLNPSFQWL
jgi:hypothetical protein